MNTQTGIRVGVIYSGGTIGCVPSDPRDPASPLVPGLLDALRARLAEAFAGQDIPLPEYDWLPLTDAEGRPAPPLDSSDTGPRHWEWMARAVAANSANYGGFVILHGTDTMAFTASALAFLLAGLEIPVVLTGARQTIHAPRSDAPANLSGALRLAAWSGPRGERPAEVMIAFDGLILRGARATKTDSDSGSLFLSPKFPTLGRFSCRTVEIGPDARLAANAPEAAAPALAALDPRVAVIHLWPGIAAAWLEAALLRPDVRGALLLTFGSGDAPTDPALLNVIERAVRGEAAERGAPRLLVNVSQCIEGRVEPSLYAAAHALTVRGVVSGRDLTTEAALAKLQWALGRAKDSAAARALFERNVAGEMQD